MWPCRLESWSDYYWLLFHWFGAGDESRETKNPCLQVCVFLPTSKILVWYGMVWCDVLWRGMAWYGMVGLSHVTAQ